MEIDIQKRHRNEFKEYFLQFLMVFLAVVLGTIGENYREHYSNEVNERNMERETLQALSNDLTTDLANLEKSINNKSEKEDIAKNLIKQGLLETLKSSHSKTIQLIVFLHILFLNTHLNQKRF